MGKLKNTSSENIINFLNDPEIKLSTDWVKNSAITNICLLYASVLFLDNKLFWMIIFTILNTLIAVLLVYYLKKVEHSKKNICLFSGIYSCLLAVSLSVFSYSLISRVVDWSGYFLLILILMNLLTSLITVLVKCRKILNNAYSIKSYVAVGGIGAASVAGVLISKSLTDINPFIIISLCMAVCSICFATSSHMLLRYYCCLILKKREEIK